MKRIDPAQLSSLKLVVTGAEKLPQSLANAFEEKFGIRPQEGYGLTETSPGTNVNLPDPEPETNAITMPSSRNGSVGQMLPGLAIKITDPATDRSGPDQPPGHHLVQGLQCLSRLPRRSEKNRRSPQGRLVPHRRCRPRR